MANALLRACSTPGCRNLTRGGPCPSCATAREQRRGSAHHRGYGAAWGGASGFRQRFSRMLIARGIAPVCGASLPGGPDTKRYSRCATEGRLNDRDLHLDHQPPLTADERERARQGDRSAIDDPLRVGFLCASDHAAKTQREQQTGAST